LFPAITGSNYFYATLVDAANNYEIVKVTARATDVLTVTRAQEGTAARAFAAASKLELRVTAAGLGNLVQLDGAQTITGVKTFSTALAVASGGTGVTTSTGSGNNVLSTSPTLVTPALGTPSALVGTNITGTAAGLTAGTATNATNLVTTNFTIQEVGGVLVFKYGATTIASIDSTGVITSQP
jgi:hypothetical protein